MTYQQEDGVYGTPYKGRGNVVTEWLVSLVRDGKVVESKIVGQHERAAAMLEMKQKEA